MQDEKGKILKDSENTKQKRILGYRNYESDKKEFFEEDFEDPKNIGIFLEEVSNGESDLTNLGKTFLLKKLREEGIAQKIMNAGEGPYNVANKEELMLFLEEVIPHDTASFIAGVRDMEERKAGE